MLAEQCSSGEIAIVERVLILGSEEGCRLARELAELTGESIDTAVTTAIREQLEQERGKIARFREFLCAAAKKLTNSASDPGCAD
ncbi:MAG: type II toxin-antitoxin system VapB family antitoxin [Alphaproteobacteria bacterium]|nr:type II toxin-antitoxin system VapB family antitoxin [Alphaproteobacteria bacterium]